MECTLVKIFVSGSPLGYDEMALAQLLSPYGRIGAKRMQVRVMWAICIFLLLLNAAFAFWRHDLLSGSALLLCNLADPLLSVAIFPNLMSLCLKQVEGSQFTTYPALINFCDVLGSYTTG